MYGKSTWVLGAMTPSGENNSARPASMEEGWSRCMELSDGRDEPGEWAGGMKEVESARAMVTTQGRDPLTRLSAVTECLKIFRLASQVIEEDGATAMTGRRAA